MVRKLQKQSQFLQYGNFFLPCHKGLQDKKNVSFHTLSIKVILIADIHSGLCRTWSDTPQDWYSDDAAQMTLDFLIGANGFIYVE